MSARLAWSLVALASALLLSPAACVGTTGSERFAFEARAGGPARAEGGPLTFVNDYGYEVTLTRALLHVGPVYLNTITPLQGAGARRFSPLGLIKTAHADSAHLGEGRVVGEVLGQATIDALSPSLTPFATTGVITREQIRTAELWFYPPPTVSPDTVDIDQPAAEVEGTATRDGVTVAFKGKLTLNGDFMPDVAPGERGSTTIDELRRVRGIPASFVPEDGGHLEIRVDPARLFSGADFANIAKNPPDLERPDVKVLTQGKSGKYTTDQVMRTVYNGLRSTGGTYAITWRDR